jgi:6-phosphogluconolactonase (cycloisomerase 2 family)
MMVGRFVMPATGVSVRRICGFGVLAFVLLLAACSGGGGTGAPPATTPRFSGFVYVANFGGSPGTVSAFTINAATGALTAVAGSPFAAGSSPFSVTVDPSGKFAYVANYWSNDVSAFTINAATGALTPVAGSPFAAGSPVAAGIPRPASVTVDPSGKFAFVANFNDRPSSVSAFTIDAATGALTQVLNSPFPAGNGPIFVTVHPSGQFAYVANANSNDISTYTVATGNGALVACMCSSPAVGTNPVSVTVDPSGKFLYVVNRGSNDVSAFEIDALGNLYVVPGSPFAVGAVTTVDPSGSGPNSVTVGPSGKFAYVANHNSNNVSVFTINAATGGLTEVAGSPFAAGSAPLSVTVDPTGKFAYVTSQNSGVPANNVFAYTINAATGALTPVAGSPFAAGSHPVAVTTTGPIN